MAFLITSLGAETAGVPADAIVIVPGELMTISPLLRRI
jgi:hypothetical protein